MSDNPDLMKEWDWELNTELDASKLSYGSNKTASWICEKRHRWEATISDRSRGRKCPYCSGRRILVGYNDLATSNPKLTEQWHPTKNGTLTPHNVSAGSNKKVWWKCEKGHEWEAVIYTRVKGVGCPICGKVTRVINNTHNQIKVKGSLALKFPDLAKEWNCVKNGKLSPEDVLTGSTKKVWWRCVKGHEWNARISHRVSGVGCPICAQITQSSFPEQAILYYLKQYMNVEHRYIHNGFEIDVYLPEYRIGIEYDGVYYHKGEKSFEHEQRKDKALSSDGIILIRIKETWNVEDVSNKSIIYCVPTSGNTHMNHTIHILAKRLSFMTGVEFYNLDINVQRDQIEIRNQLQQLEREHSAYSIKPELQEELQVLCSSCTCCNYYGRSFMCSLYLHRETDFRRVIRKHYSNACRSSFRFAYKYTCVLLSKGYCRSCT